MHQWFSQGRAIFSKQQLLFNGTQLKKIKKKKSLCDSRWADLPSLISKKGADCAAEPLSARCEGNKGSTSEVSPGES